MPAGETWLAIGGIGTDKIYARLMKDLLAVLGINLVVIPIPKGQFSIERYAEELYESAVREYGESLNLVAVSMGGALALQMAHKHPAQIKRLVLISTCAGRGSRPGKLLPTSALMLSGLVPSLYPVLARLIHGHELDPELGDAATGRISAFEFGLRGSAAMRWSAYSWLDEIGQDHQVLVVHGAGDEIVPVINGQWLAEGIGCQMVRVEDGSHSIVHTHSGQIAKAMAEWLSE